MRFAVASRYIKKKLTTNSHCTLTHKCLGYYELRDNFFLLSTKNDLNDSVIYRPKALAVQ